MLDERITALRKLHGLTQAKLAKRIHVSAAAISAYERGRRTPDLTALLALSREFELTTDYLLTGIPSSEQDINTVKHLLISRLRQSDITQTALLSECPSRAEILCLAMRSLLE